MAKVVIDYLVVSTGYDGRLTTNWLQRNSKVIDNALECWEYIPKYIEEDKEAANEDDTNLKFVERMTKRGLIGVVTSKGSYGGDLRPEGGFEDKIVEEDEEKIIFCMENDNPIVKQIITSLELSSGLIFQSVAEGVLMTLSNIFELDYCGCFNLRNACSTTIHTIAGKNVMFVETDSESG